MGEDCPKAICAVPASDKRSTECAGMATTGTPGTHTLARQKPRMVDSKEEPRTSRAEQHENDGSTSVRSRTEDVVFHPYNRRVRDPQGVFAGSALTSTSAEHVVTLGCRSPWRQQRQLCTAGEACAAPAGPAHAHRRQWRSRRTDRAVKACCGDARAHCARVLHTSCVLGDCSQCPATGRLPRAASCVGGAAPPPQPTRAAVATTSSARQRVRGSRDSSNSARTCLHAHAHRRTHTRRSRLPCLLRCTVRIAAAAVARWRDAASRPLAPHAALLVSPALRSVPSRRHHRLFFAAR